MTASTLHDLVSDLVEFEFESLPGRPEPGDLQAASCGHCGGCDGCSGCSHVNQS